MKTRDPATHATPSNHFPRPLRARCLGLAVLVAVLCLLGVFPAACWKAEQGLENQDEAASAGVVSEAAAGGATAVDAGMPRLMTENPSCEAVIDVNCAAEVDDGGAVAGIGGGDDDEEPADPLTAEIATDEESLPGKTAPEGFSAEDWKKEIAAEWEKLLALFESEGISVDLEKKRVSVKGVIIRDKGSPRYPIEYVVVSEGGNTHEALVLVKATPSNLNAALLALGLSPGKTVIFRKKDPPPPVEEVEAGKTSAYEAVPPTGTKMKIYVHWEEWTTDPYRPLEDLILDLRSRKSMERVGWIYVGSRFAEVLLGRKRVRQYMADMERNVVALYLTGYGNAIFDLNALDGVDDSIFDVNPDRAPPMGAQITLVFTEEKIENER